MQVWNLDTRQVAGPPLRHANDVSCVAFSFDGRYLVGGCCDFRIWVWDADVIRRPSPDAPPPLPKAEPFPLPTTDPKDEDNTVLPAVSPALIPLPPSPNSLLGSILELPRSHHTPFPPTGSDKQAQMEPPPAVTRRTDSVGAKGLWKWQKRRKRVCSGEGSDTTIPGVRGRLRRLVQGLSTRPGDGVLDNGADRKWPAEDIQEAKRGHDRHDPDFTSQGQDDGGEVLFLCCYFARRERRHDQPV